MKIDGKLIANEIKQKLKNQVISLKSKNVIPHLSVILIGNNPASVTYVGQKQKVAEELGIKLSVVSLPAGKKEELIATTNKFNADPNVHGIIIQRPIPIEIEKDELDNLVIPKKDIDGFHPDSPFTPPVASAVIKILEWIYKDVKTPRRCAKYSSEVEEFSKEFINWLKEKRILVIGRGETAGKPIADTLKKMGIPFVVAHSKTKNLKELCLKSDIIISCVGRPNIVRPLMISGKTILIGVGLHSENGKLQTDYNQEEIAAKATHYTPVPGGVGPVNVACLFENLTLFCEIFCGSAVTAD